MTKEELKTEFSTYLKDSTDYYDPREPLTERKLFQLWLDCAEPREKQIAHLEAQIAEMKRCEICKHYQFKSCNYHSNWEKDCKANGMKLFELKEIKEK